MRPLSSALIVAGSLAATQVAYAADLPIKAPPVVAPAYNWTGFYVGGNVGGAWGQTDYELAVPQLFSVVDPAVNLAAAQAGTGSLHPKGFTGGIQAGYNYQIQNWVTGLEVDFGAMNLRGSSNFAGTFPLTIQNPFSGSQLSVQTSMNTDWLFTARGRLGFSPWARTLIYATGGLAVTRVNYSQTNTYTFLGGVDVETGNLSQTKTGWTIGGGAEWALWNNQWSVKAEYLYLDFGSVTGQAFIPAIAFTSSATSPFVHTANLNANIARLGLNYKFSSY